MSRQVIQTMDFAREAADFIATRARAALSSRGEFRLALSGGNTPRPVYSELAQRELPWEKAILTFGDERCVPPEDAQSNFRMARETLFDPGHVPESSILRMRGELEPAIAADEYQRQLDALAEQRHEQIYQHDLILLGIGDDGHTASLFPNTTALHETTRRVAANYVPKLEAWRLTFTLPLIFAAHEICFLVKKSVSLVERVFSGDESLPSTLVDRGAKHVTWILGKA